MLCKAIFVSESKLASMVAGSTSKKVDRADAKECASKALGERMDDVTRETKPNMME